MCNDCMDRAENLSIVAQEYDLPKYHQLMQWCALFMEKSDPESQIQKWTLSASTCKFATYFNMLCRNIMDSRCCQLMNL